MRKLKLLSLATAALFSAGAWAQTDVTSTYLTNADFEGNYSVKSNPKNDRAIYAPEGWTVSYSNGEENDMTILNSSDLAASSFNACANIAQGGTNTYKVRFRWGSSEIIDMKQTISLEAGTYHLMADVLHHNGASGTMTIYANSTTTTIEKSAAWQQAYLTFTLDGTTNVNIGFTVTQKKQEEFITGIDNFTLYKDGDEASVKLAFAKASAARALTNEAYNTITGSERTAIASYESATDASALHAAITSFTSVKSTYDNYAAALAYGKKISNSVTGSLSSADGYSDAINALNVAEYNAIADEYVDVTSSYSADLSTWSFSTNVSEGAKATNKGEHWDGQSSTTYYEQGTNSWNASSFTDKYTKSVTLPKGVYVLKVSGRANTNVTLTVADGTNTQTFASKSSTGRGVETSGQANFSEDGSYANSNNGRGWEWRYIPVTLESAGSVTFTIQASASSKTGWFSVANAALLMTAESKYAAALESAQAVNQELPIATTALTALQNAINMYGSGVSDYEAAAAALEAATSAATSSISQWSSGSASIANDIAGWTCSNTNTFHTNTWSTEGNSDGTGMTTPFIENWRSANDNAPLGNGVIKYSVSNAVAGTYKVSGLIRVYDEHNTTPTGGNFFVNGQTISIDDAKDASYNGKAGKWGIFTDYITLSEAGTLEFGLNISSANYNWVALKGFSVTKLSDAEVSAAATAYTAELAKAAALEASLTVSEPADVAGKIKATQELKVMEYEYVMDTYVTSIELGDWTPSAGTGSMSSEHWDGTSTSTYLEQSSNNYSANSWSISYTNSVTLPAGDYVFKVAGRHSSGSVSLSLKVQNDETSIGTISDFPAGNKGLGINTSGETDYSVSGTYANNGIGRGWEWRYVPFTVETETTISLAVEASASAKYQWVGFCNSEVLSKPNLEASKIAYEQSKEKATTALASETYTNIGVTATERTTLVADVAAEVSGSTDLEKMTWYDTQKATIDTHLASFEAAVTSYNDLATAKTEATTFVPSELPYASASKYEAISTAVAATATSATDATEKAADVRAAYRKYIESNALAEGVTGAETVTIADPNMDVTYDGTNHTFGAWTVIGQTNGAIQLLTSESFTDGDGKNNYKYADIYKSDNNAGIQQTVNLAPGRYLLTVTARANTTSEAGFRLFAGGSQAEISRIGNTGGTFNRGWNDKSLEFAVTEQGDVNIGVQSYNGKDLWWSATRFRMVKLPAVMISEGVDYTPASTVNNVNLTRTIKADTWNTFCVPFAISNAELKAAFGDDVAVAEFSETANGDNSTINFNTMAEPAVAANTPVLLKTSTAGKSYTFNGRTIETGDAQVTGGTNFNFVGTYAASTTIASGDYFIGSNQLWESAGSTTISGTRAYIKAVTAGAKVIGFTIDDEEVTAIDGIDLSRQDSDRTYNVAGQQVTAPAKGLYIRNGKKIVVR